MNRREMIVGSILGLFWRKPPVKVPALYKYHVSEYLDDLERLRGERREFEQLMARAIQKRLAQNFRKLPNAV